MLLAACLLALAGCTSMAPRYTRPAAPVSDSLPAGVPAIASDAGAVADQFRTGAFGLPWNAGKTAIQAKYPGGQWDKDAAGTDRYCAPSRQSLLGLPAQHQTRELCFLIGGDGTMASATARLDATLPSLLAVVNRSRTRFGDFDAVKRDEGAIQSRFENAVANIQIQSENATAAKSRIMDTDFAAETANMTRAQILQQAGTAMLSQANQIPQSVLSLLR